MSREEKVTPPNGSERDPQTLATLRRGDVELVLEHVRRNRMEVLSRIAQVESKVDGGIDDIRQIRGTLATINRSVAEERDIIRDGLVRGLQRDAERATAIRNLSSEVAALGAAVIRIEAAVGKPPEEISLGRASQTGDLTAAELEALEKGSGLFRIVGRLIANDVRAAQEAGRAAGAAAARRTGTIVGIASTAGTVAAATAEHWVPALIRMFGG